MHDQKWYMVGGPSFGQVNGFIKEFRAPAGQLELCYEILKETCDPKRIAEKMSEEYFAIILALKEMGINFYITYSKSELEYKKLLAICTNKLGIKLMGLPKGSPLCFASYPRDMFTVMESGIILVNPLIIWLKAKEENGYKIISSVYGEGGSVLFSKKTILVAERFLDDERPMSEPKISILEKNGLNVGLLPLPVAGTFVPAGIKNKFIVNNHLDRIGCLIKGKDEKLHLVVDSNIHVARITGSNSWEPCGRDESVKKIKKVCEEMGIIFHSPASTKVPYIFNLVQFFDGRVLMSGGDKDAYNIIAGIIGKENIMTTEIPIRYLPVYAFAGIRCIINDVPVPLLT